MAIITISRQMGSLGDEIARSAADKLGYEQIGKSQIGEVLLEHGFSASDLDKYDEKSPSLLQHLSIQKSIFSHLIRAAVYELAAKGEVMIVGRGAQVILKDIPGTLHVRDIAPHAIRANRLMEQNGNDREKAQWVIEQGDRNSSGYIHTYFNANWDDSELYDLVLNTRTMAPSTCVEMIVRAVGTDEFRKSSRVTEKMIDLALTQKVKAALLEVDGVEGTDLIVENGIVRFSGPGIPPEARKACEKALSNIKGIKEIT